jgi:hypothetical protein
VIDGGWMAARTSEERVVLINDGKANANERASER